MCKIKKVRFYNLLHLRVFKKILTISDMKLNWTTKIVGEKVILVPYCAHHVPKYHEWMQSEELQHLTGSEPLSFEEELQMQETWKNSEDKCTFIILHKESYEAEKDEIGAMIGDTNIFMSSDEMLLGEAEIMIAETKFRGQKLGWESMVLMLLYGIDHLKIEKFEAKIKLENAKSIQMFEKLRFKEQSRSQVFQEITMGIEITEEWTGFLRNCISDYQLLKYHHEESD